jgi:cell division protein FtsZ
MNPPRKTETNGQAARHIRLKLVGVGGAGGNAVQTLAGNPTNLAGIELLAINTDAQALDAITGAEKLPIGSAITHGLGAGGDPELGARAAQQDTEPLRAALHGADIVFLAAGLGGGTGTGASPLVARLAKEQGALVLAFVALPFAFEGKRRTDQAALGLDQLKAAADAVICLPNDRLFKALGGEVAATEAFARGNQIIANGVQALWQLLSRKGLINLDFADLRATLGGKHAEGLFAHGEAAGPERVREAVKQLLENPLFDADETLSRAEGVLVSILGGPDLTLTDVQRIVEPISKLAQRAQVIMGAAIDDAYREKLAVTVIASTASTTRRFSGTRTVPSRPAAAAAKPVEPAPLVLTGDPAPIPTGKGAPKQEDLPLQPVSRGRFSESEPTLYNGEDLDVPTFIRRGIRIA